MNSFGNGIFLDNNVPMLEGTWYNPQTGDHFTVRDCFIEDNGIKVMTTDGRMLDYNIIQRYIKSDKPIPKMEPPKPPKKTTAPKKDLTEGLTQSPVPESIDSFLTPEDAALLGTPLDVPTDDLLSKPLNTNNISVQPKVELKNADIIAKGLKKAEVPKIDVRLSWKNYPSKELDALTTIMDVPEEDIVEWMVSEYFKFDDLKLAIKEFLNNVMKDGYYNSSEKAEIKAEETKEAEKTEPKKNSAGKKAGSTTKKNK